jgi:hypothetical protein
MGLDLAEALMDIEDRYGIEITSNFPLVETVQNLADAVTILIREQKGIEPDSKEILSEIIEIINKSSTRFRWSKKNLTPETKLSDVLSL